MTSRGRPALPPRLVAGLLYLQHAFNASDEAVVSTWLENPYWQYFTGETYLQTELPIDPSSLTRWRKRLGEAGVELLLSLTINAAKQLTVVKERSLDRVIVDTTVMPKAIAHPTDNALLEAARQHMVAFAKENSLALRQNYNKEAPRLAIATTLNEGLVVVCAQKWLSKSEHPDKCILCYFERPYGPESRESKWQDGQDVPTHPS